MNSKSTSSAPSTLPKTVCPRSPLKLPSPPPKISSFRHQVFKLTQKLPPSIGHFRYLPDLLTAAMNFRRGNLALVSISLDGASPPDIYVLSDIRTYNANPSLFTPSPVRFLNGADAVSTIKNLSLQGVLQDRDALYNSMFFSPAMNAAMKGAWQGYYGGTGRFGYVWPGPTTDVTFLNGSTTSYRTVARIVGDFSFITDGVSFYAKYCSGTRPVTEIATPTVAVPSTTATGTRNPPEGNLTAFAPVGYPPPVVIASDQSAAGYYLPNSDVAVLSLLTYVGVLPPPSPFLNLKTPFIFPSLARTDRKRPKRPQKSPPNSNAPYNFSCPSPSPPANAT